MGYNLDWLICQATLFDTSLLKPRTIVTIVSIYNTHEKSFFIKFSFHSFLLCLDIITAKLLILINFYCYIFTGVLRDINDETPLPPTYNLSGSQNIAYHHVLQTLSTMEPKSNEFLEEEVHDCEHSYISQFACQNCR